MDSESQPTDALFRFACRENVEKMPETEGGHHCDRCTKTVVDLSQLTEPEARSLVRRGDPKTCVSYLVDGRGDLVFRAPRATGTLAIGLAAFLAACSSGPAPTSPAPGPALHSESSGFESVPPPSRPGVPSLRPPEDTWPSARSSDPRGSSHPETHTQRTAHPGSDSWPSASSKDIEGRTHLPVVQPPPLVIVRPRTAGKPVLPGHQVAGGLRAVPE
jgi:hypothetical protein